MISSKTPLMFSLVMPVFNTVQHLKICLDSILSQSCKEWELICIDDGSTDGSAELLDEYALKDSRVRVVKEGHGGVSCSRNNGIALSVGSYIGFVDSDDMIERNWLSDVKEIIAEWHPDLVRMNFRYLDNKIRNVQQGVTAEKESVFASAEEVCKWGWTAYPNGGWPWLNFIKREVLQQSGVMFPNEVSVKEDVLFGLMLIPHLRLVVQSPKAGYNYRIRRDSAWHLKRRSDDCIKFINSALNIWRIQKVTIKQAGCEVAACNELGLAIWTDVLEWIDRRDCVGSKGEKEISALLKECMDEGIVSASSLPWRWRVGLYWLNIFKSISLLVLTCHARRYWIKIRHLKSV